MRERRAAAISDGLRGSRRSTHSEALVVPPCFINEGDFP